MTNNQLTDERLVKILSETQAAISEHNCRQVRGCVEVDARLFESMLIEIQERRLADKNCLMYGIVNPDGSAYLDEFCVSSDAKELQCVVDELNEMQCEGGGDFRVVALYTALPLTDSEREELQELRRNYLALRGEIEDVRSQLYEAENQATEYASELQEHRKAETADRETLKQLARIMSGSDAPGEIRSLTVTAQSLVDRCQQLATRQPVVAYTDAEELAAVRGGGDGVIWGKAREGKCDVPLHVVSSKRGNSE